MKVTPFHRVAGEVSSAASLAKLPAAKSTKVDLKSDVFSAAPAPKAENAAPAAAAGVGKKGAAALKALFENELHTLADRYRNRYGAFPVKKKDFGWDVDAAEAKFKAGIVVDPAKSQDENLAAFQLHAHQFINAMNDYHVSMALNRTASARLPFRIRPIGDTFAISSIDREKLPRESFPFSEGDEVIAIDGKPIADVIAENMKYLPHSNALADNAAAATMVTVLRGRVAEPMPTSQTRSITVKRGDGKTLTHDLSWNVTEERIKPKLLGPGSLNIRGLEEEPKMPSLDMTAHRYIDTEALAAAGKQGGVDPFLMGGRKTLLPDLGPIIFRTEATSPFDAYIYRAPNGKNVGVIRLPTFGVDKPALYVAEFAKLIEKMEATTDGLIIDQNNNPGGYFHYMMALLSMLSPQPMKMPMQQEKITAREAAEADAMLQELKDITTDEQAKAVFGNDIAGYPVSLDIAERFRAYYKHILSEFNAGKDFTDAFPLSGMGTVNPSTRTTYSKPILCLTNATCYSCGDFFPSALKENKRAVIMGETTAGAGGYVIREKWINKVGIDFVTITGSVADLDDKDPSRVERPLEGHGVEPDVKCSPTLRDLRANGADMKAAVNAQIMKMMG